MANKKKPEKPKVLAVQVQPGEALLILNPEMGVRGVFPEQKPLEDRPLNCTLIVALMGLLTMQPGFAEGCIKWVQDREAVAKSGIILPNQGGLIRGH